MRETLQCIRRARGVEYMEVPARRPYNEVLNRLAADGWRVIALLSNDKQIEQCCFLMERKRPRERRDKVISALVCFLVALIICSALLWGKFHA